MVLWCTAGGRHDEPRAQRELHGTGSVVQHLCISAAALLWPIHLPLNQGKSALKDACPSVKREKKEPLIHIASGEDCAPTAGENNIELSSW